MFVVKLNSVTRVQVNPSAQQVATAVQTEMATAASLVISTYFHCAYSVTVRKPSSYLLNSLHLHRRRPIHPFSPSLFLLPNSRNPPTTTPTTCLHKLNLAKNCFSSAFDSLLLLCTSVALSSSLFFADVDSATAFVVTTPRKLQTDELATVRLFQENTPSVVYITNLAVRLA